MTTADYRQCVLENGGRRQTAWLPLEFCVCGKVIALGKRPNLDDGWIVTSVGTVAPPAYVLERKAHRRGDFGSLADA